MQYAVYDIVLNCFSHFTHSRDSRQSRVFTQSVSQSVDTRGKTRRERFTSTFPNAARNHRTLASQVTFFFTWNHPPALRMEPPPRTIMQLYTVSYGNSKF